MKKNGYISVLLAIALVLIVGLTVWYLRQEVEVSPVEDITWNDTGIADEEGNQLLAIDYLPDEIQVSPDTAFGDSQSFTAAVLSPDKNWIAIGVRGAAHEFGWVYNILLDEITPVSFQFGGSVEPVNWDPASTFVVFQITSPGDFTRLEIVDRRELTEYPTTTGFIIEAPIEEALPPEEVSYKFLRWENSNLCFTANDITYCIDPETRIIEKMQ